MACLQTNANTHGSFKNHPGSNRRALENGLIQSEMCSESDQRSLRTGDRVCGPAAGRERTVYAEGRLLFQQEIRASSQRIAEDAHPA